MYKHILVPTDGSEQSENATRQAVRLAATLGSKVTFLTVTQPLPLHCRRTPYGRHDVGRSNGLCP